MLIGEMIKRLEALREKHGDLPVFIEQKFTDDGLRMEIEKISAELTQFGEISWEEFEQMDDMGLVNSIVITDCPD
jgi:hypothetical protein